MYRQMTFEGLLSATSSPESGDGRSLRLAGIADDFQCWTASCPCQPFSVAGKGLGHRDERHLWPILFNLIKERQPPIIFGEQVASSETLGSSQEADFLKSVQAGDYARANKLARRLVASPAFHYHRRWIDGVSADLESAHYACVPCDIPAACLNAPHIRQRLYWCGVRVSDAESWRRQQFEGERSEGVLGEKTQPAQCVQPVGGHGSGTDADRPPLRLADVQREGFQELSGDGNGGNQPGRVGEDEAGSVGAGGKSFWSRSIFIPCRDGKWRRVPGRVGNAAGSGQGADGGAQGDGRHATESEQDRGMGNTNVPEQGCGKLGLRAEGRNSDGAERAYECAQGRGHYDGATAESQAQSEIFPLVDDGQSLRADMGRRGSGGVEEVAGDKAAAIDIDPALFAGFATPRQTDAKCGGQYTENMTGNDLAKDASLCVAGYPTPKASSAGETSRGGDRKDELLMGGIARGMVGYEDAPEIDPDLFPLTEKTEGRVMLLKGAGNAIVPQVAAAFIQAFDGACSEGLE